MSEVPEMQVVTEWLGARQPLAVREVFEDAESRWCSGWRATSRRARSGGVWNRCGGGASSS